MALAIEPQLRFRLGETFFAELSWSYNDIDIPAGAFTTNLGRIRLSYNFTTLVSLQALIQYNDRDEVWAANLRFTWLREAGSGLHVVHNEIQDLYGDLEMGDLGGARAASRSLIIKYSYLFDLLK